MNISSIATHCATVAATTFAIISTSAILAFAGTLTPPGPPAATMRTLEEQKPAWNKIIPATQRFEDALDGTAVLDKETGLVWAKSADANQSNWQSAMDYCTNLYLGGRKGWRLPTVQELSSLIDTPNQVTNSLPVGNPFSNVQFTYWSSSSSYNGTSFPSFAWSVILGPIPAFSGLGQLNIIGKDALYSVWPVRSGQKSIDQFFY